jgi:hypothetical protein
MLDKKHRGYAERAFLRGPIGTYSVLIKQATEGKGHLSLDWPANLILLYAEKFFDGYALVRAEQQISIGAVIAILETVRNKILAFTLELEGATPEITQETDRPLEPATREKVSQVFHMHIYGNVANVAAGSSDFSQNAVTQVTKGDWTSLKKALSEIGVPSVELEALEAALQKDGDVKGQIGTNSSHWLGNMIEKAASGTWQVGLSVAGTMIPKLLSKYFGIPD